MTSTKIRATIAALAATFAVTVAVAPVIPTAHARPTLTIQNKPIAQGMDEHDQKL